MYGKGFAQQESCGQPSHTVSEKKKKPHDFVLFLFLIHICCS